MCREGCEEVGDENRKEDGGVHKLGPPLSDSTEAWRMKRETLGRLLVTGERKSGH